MGDAADQGGEHQRRDDHLDQAQEQHRDQVYVGRDLGPAVGQIVEDQRAHHDAERHRDQDVLRKPVGHFLTPVSLPATQSLADFRTGRNTLCGITRLARMFPLWN